MQDNEENDTEEISQLLQWDDGVTNVLAITSNETMFLPMWQQFPLVQRHPTDFTLNTSSTVYYEYNYDVLRVSDYQQVREPILRQNPQVALVTITLPPPLQPAVPVDEQETEKGENDQEKENEDWLILNHNNNNIDNEPIGMIDYPIVDQQIVVGIVTLSFLWKDLLKKAVTTTSNESRSLTAVFTNPCYPAGSFTYRIVRTVLL